MIDINTPDQARNRQISMVMREFIPMLTERPGHRYTYQNYYWTDWEKIADALQTQCQPAGWKLSFRLEHLQNPQEVSIVPISHEYSEYESDLPRGRPAKPAEPAESKPAPEPSPESMLWQVTVDMRSVWLAVFLSCLTAGLAGFLIGLASAHRI